MSTLSHLGKRLKHYADPRTAFKASVHATQRAAHYADPRVHLQAAQRAAHQVARTAKQHGQFIERQARKDYVKFNRVTSYIAPVVTPILAFVGELIPVFGLIIGPALSFMGAVIARISTSVALRSKGVTGLENSQKSRAKQNRTLKYGLYGSAAGGLASAAGLGFSAAASAPAAAAPAATPGLVTAPGAASGALEGVIGGASVGQQASTIGALSGAQIGAEVGSAFAGFSVPTVPLSFSPESVAPKAAPSAAPSAPSSGILGTGITWGNVGSVLSPLVSIAPTLMKALGIGQPKPAGQAGPGGSYGVGEGGGAGGTEGTGEVGAEGPLGALADTLSGLPLPIKLGAAALGLGAVAFAFKKGKLA